ncbi:MAG: protein-ADP-ribose hydrolase [Lachnospiraceae bacterium]|nr:protein-ADP-ribose hydrolase [Lachnospiraceae bacterium]
MTQGERRKYLLEALLRERQEYARAPVPAGEQEQKKLLRALFNVRMPQPADDAFLRVQDAYLQEETRRKGVTELADLKPVQPGIYLWRGDITTLRCDAIVNAANSGMLGCFCPNHGCIDNAIHTFAGVQLREACAELMRRQGHDEATGGAKLTPAFNLPCKYVLHTVGPIVRGAVTPREEEQLASCYRSCLALAEESGVKSVAFCCISTGEFHFPNKRAAEIAVRTVKAYQAQTKNEIEVIFNVFKESDYQIYSNLLGGCGSAPRKNGDAEA